MADGPNFERIVGFPAGAAVVRDYLDGNPDAVAFYGGHFRDPAAYDAKRDEVDARFHRDARERAASALRVPPGGDAARLERFVEEGGYCVTTGQQPGLFGGPLYSVYKALTAVRLAEALEARMGRPVLPVFWVGSEDHDWEEANHTYVIDTDNELRRVEVARPDPDRSPPLFRAPMGPDAAEAARAFLDALPRTDFTGPWMELLEAAVAPGRTITEGSTELLQALVGPYGVYFTDASLPEVKRASLDVLFAELERAEELEAVLDATDQALTGAGYGRQVALMPGGVNVFMEGPAGRERLYRTDGAFELHTSGLRVSLDEIRAAAEADVNALSPNVFLRPVVESTVFPTLSYIGGPGEMAYFAQLRDYFEAHGVRMPVLHPRLGVTVVEPKIRKVLDKFGLDVEGLNRPFHEVASEIARDEVPPEVRSALGSLRGAIARGVGEVQKAVQQVDPTLKGTVQHVRSHAFDALDDLEKKIVHAVKRENEIALAQLEKAQVHLFPEGKPQERVLSPFYYVARYGGAFLEGILDGFRVELG